MAEPSTDRPEPTAEERRNGWDAESLAAYLAERQAQKETFAAAEAKRRPLRVETTTTFNPHRWGN